MISFDKIKNIAALILTVITILSVTYGMSGRKEAKRTQNILYSVEKEYRDSEGRHARVTAQFETTQRELRIARQKAKNDSSLLSDYELQLLEADRIIHDQKLKIRNIESVSMTEMLESSSHETTYEIDSSPLITGEIPIIRIDPIETAHLRLEFDVLPSGNIIVSHEYRNKLYVILNRQKTNNKGKKRILPKLQFWHDWEYMSTVVSQDTNAIIESSVQIKF